MHVFILAVLAIASASAQQPRDKTPENHPPAPRPDNRLPASELTEKLRPSDKGRNSAAVPRKNLIDESIFSRIERDRVPHAPLSGDEEFFRRVHLDLTGRIPDDDELRDFPPRRIRPSAIS